YASWSPICSLFASIAVIIPKLFPRAWDCDRKTFKKSSKTAKETLRNINQKNRDFSFEISLSVLNHLGRNLYRSFATVLGEAISNSWDADAETVRIFYDRATSGLVICDDGEGMTARDFQYKFLKIGYSKRRENVSRSTGG